MRSARLRALRHVRSRPPDRAVRGRLAAARRRPGPDLRGMRRHAGIPACGASRRRHRRGMNVPRRNASGTHGSPPVLDLDETPGKVPALRPFRGVIARLAGRTLMLDRFTNDINDWQASEGYSATLDGLLQLHGVSVEIAHGDPARL